MIPHNPDQEETFALVAPGYTYESVTEKISSLVLNNKISLKWLAAVAFTAFLVSILQSAVTVLMLFGVGIWGVNIPVAWGFAIISFVWWIGFGHAGTLISAILLLLHQNWRTSINRFAEAMTLFAVMQAGMYPLLHIGRHQYFYWMFPVPDTMGLWPQFRSPLMWDVFAINTYLLVSLMFWFVGLIPDLASLRDRSNNPLIKRIYGALAMGWRGSAKHWHRYAALYLLLAGLSTPLVVSVHTIVSYDFAVGNVPGWHSTIFPPYFVAGALFQGFALVLILAIPLRATCGLKGMITMRHLENMGKLMLATGLIVFYGYFMEAFFGWYSANKYESYMTFNNRMWGPYAPVYWALIFCNGFTPQVLWFKRMRTSVPVLFIVSMIVSIGMFLERFIIVVTSLSEEFMPTRWGIYRPTVYDWATLAGTIGMFSLLFLMFCRVLPVISMAEMRELVRHEGHSASFVEHGAEPAPVTRD